jgi:ABC-type arginine transport system ATPase subunit
MIMNNNEQIVYDALIDVLIDSETNQINESLRGISQTGLRKIIAKSIKDFRDAALEIVSAEEIKIIALNELDEDEFEQLKVELFTVYDLV